ncbi:ras-related protein rab-10 [Stylonychia lemnae]|uniref:Ras-related protein rab-10 n=1 Tax=Stylonychia lemnae TaxID=5949 RepID=A0A078AZZ8_STYLE|nr:ras-related protein rab-10 [Stylonychia lemnae]|eukprot:CDW87990.1 ras-related protein rab-10 [Stylonychia lemnae]
MHVMILGDGAVGKSSILKQYHNNKFTNQHIKTLGVDFIQTQYKKGEQSFDVKIWDTAGQERFKTITYQFYRQANGMIIAFDITNLESFENVKTWMNSIYKHADPSIAKVLVGNKIDLEEQRVVTKAEATKIAQEHGMDYFETSARDNINIQELLQYIMDKVYDNLYSKGTNENEEVDHGKTSIQINKRTQAQKSGAGSNNGGLGEECKC